jgi:hypothetical protein
MPWRSITWTDRGTILTAVGTCILALGTCALAGLGYKQSFDMKEQLQTMKLQAEATKDTKDILWNSVYKVQRPYLYMEMGVLSPDDKTMSMWTGPMTVGNSGNTPTKNLIYSVDCSERVNDVIAFFNNELSETANIEEIAPKAYTNVNNCKISKMRCLY